MLPNEFITIRGGAMSNETEELNMPGFGFVWDFGDKQMRLTKNGVELSLTFEQAGSLVEQIWRLLDDAGAGPAAGSWIRVDSETPPPDDLVLCSTDDGCVALKFGRCSAGFTRWARIYLPRKP